MPKSPLNRGAVDATARRVAGLLRRAPMTVDELARELGLTDNAVRAHLAALERDGIVARAGMRPGVTRPSVAYTITPEGELHFSSAYIPVLTELLHVLSERMRRPEFDSTLRAVGDRLMAGRRLPTGTPEERVRAASDLLNELGAVTTADRANGHWRITGYGCPLAAATRHHPEACNAVESLLSAFVGAPVATCCEREPRLRCCFDVELRSGRAARSRS